MSILSSKRGAKNKASTVVGYQSVRYQPIDELSVPHAQPQNVPTARVYVFGDSNVAEDEILNTDESDAYELRPRGKGKALSKEKPESDILTIERTIQKGETLPKIAVKYCCEVADLKRINNLFTDQDFFALSTIKVPVQRHGLVRERLEEEIKESLSHESSPVRTKNVNGSAVKLSAGVHNGLFDEIPPSDNETWRGIDDNISDSECDERKELMVRTVSIPTAHSNSGKEAESFLKKMDKDIKNILTSTNSQKRNLEEVRTSLTCRRIYPLKRRDSILGADCGIKFGTIVTIIVLVALVTPLIYFLYFEYIHTPTDTSTTSDSTTSTPVGHS